MAGTEVNQITQWGEQLNNMMNQMTARADAAIQTADSIIQSLAQDPVDVGGPDVLPTAPEIVVDPGTVAVPEVSGLNFAVTGFNAPAFDDLSSLTGNLNDNPLYGMGFSTPGFDNQAGLVADLPLADLSGAGFTMPGYESLPDLVADLPAPSVNVVYEKPALVDESGLVADLPAPSVNVVYEKPALVDESGLVGDLPGADLAGLSYHAPEFVSDSGLAGDLIAADSLPNFAPTVEFSIPARPSDLTVSAVPARPETSAPVLPESPVYEAPALPTLTAVTVPSFSFEQLPTFDAVQPDFTEAMPVNGFNWQAGTYDSSMLAEVKTRLSTMLQGGTGLPLVIEEALFDRARGREDATALKATQEAVDTWAGRGFAMPPGMLVAQANAISQENQLKANDLSRDILSKAATWEIENLRVAVERAVALEVSLMEQFRAMAALGLEAAKATVEFEIQLYNSAITLYNARQQAYQVAATVFKETTDARLAVIRAELEAAQLVGQLNEQQVRVYVAEWEAVTKQVQVYTAKMSGAQVQADIVRQQIQAWEAEVNAWKTEIEAQKVSKFDTYALVMQGEGVKGGLLDAEARAYSARVDGFRASSGISVQNAQTRIAAMQASVEKFKALVSGESTAYTAGIEGVKASAQIGVQNAQTRIAAANVGVERYRADVSASTAVFSSAIEAAKTSAQIGVQNAQTRIAAANVGVERYRADVSASTAVFSSAVEAAKVSAQIGVQNAQTKIAGATAGVDKFKAMIGANQAAFMANIEAVKANAQIAVQNAQSRIAAVQVGVEKFKAEVEGEKTAITSIVEAAVANAQVGVKNAEARIAAVQAATGKFSAMVDVEAKRLATEQSYIFGVTQAETARFSAVGDFNRAAAQVAVSSTEAQGRLTASIFDVQARQYDMARERLIKKADMLRTAITAASNNASTLAAGAMSALHLGGNLDARGSYSNDYQYTDYHSWNMTQS